MSFHIPTVTTSLSGFGQWIKTLDPGENDCISIVTRDDNNHDFMVSEIVRIIATMISRPETEIQKMRTEACRVARLALWSKLIGHYYEAFSVALGKAATRNELFRTKQPLVHGIIPKPEAEPKPEWRKVMVKPGECRQTWMDC